jgi:hypothetical protein
MPYLVSHHVAQNSAAAMLFVSDGQISYAVVEYVRDSSILSLAARRKAELLRVSVKVFRLTMRHDDDSKTWANVRPMTGIGLGVRGVDHPQQSDTYMSVDPSRDRFR